MIRKLTILLILVIMISLSLGMVSAGENTTTEIQTATDDAIISVEDTDELQEEDTATDEESDLVITTERDYMSPHPDWEFTIEITAQSRYGVSRNTQVHMDLPDEFTYIGFEPSQGTFDENAKIWNIGTLNKGQKETLKITAKCSERGHFTCYFYGETSSNESDIYNNHATVRIHVSYPASASSISGSFRGYEQYYPPTNEYSDYRQITKSVNRTIDARMNEKPTANPIIPALLSLATLIGIGVKRRI